MKFNLYYEDLKSAPVYVAQTTLADKAVVLISFMYLVAGLADLLVWSVI